MEQHPTAASNAPFGTIFADVMGSSTYRDARWSTPTIHDLEALSLHPGSHVLHYASSCFEGLKAHRGAAGKVNVFRLDDHVRRMCRSAEALSLPVPDPQALRNLILDVVTANLDQVPEPPGSLYIRPVLVGTMANIGAVGVPPDAALLYVICSPVSDYFAGGLRPLRIALETELPRSTPQFGGIKAGANYAMALGVIIRAKAQLGVDQVLFAPGGEVHETGASNFLLISGEQIVTPRLTGEFLEGVTRDSVLRLAEDLGYDVKERGVTVDDVIDWSQVDGAEAALSGTAAVLAPVGTLVHKGEDILVGDGEVGMHTKRLRSALTDIQISRSPDPHGWLTPVA